MSRAEAAAGAPPLRKIIHVDMDAFYASVEQRDRPELRGRPVVVGGDPRARGVVCAASYEARRFGVRSAQAAATARRLCPQATFLTPDFEKYTTVSRQIHAIFRRYTDVVEPLSLDEAYLDVTASKVAAPSASAIAAAIRARIRRELGLTASAGVAPNKFVAKAASDLRKPDALVVVPPERLAAFVRGLSVRAIPGVGEVTERQCRRHGIRRCGDFLRHDDDTLSTWFGRAGPSFRRFAEGHDERPVVADAERRSISVEDTFPTDLASLAEARAALEKVASALERRLARAAVAGRTVTVKVKFDDFKLLTRSRTVGMPLARAAELVEVGGPLLEAALADGKRPCRLIGIGVSHLAGRGVGGQQYLHFDAAPAPEAAGGAGGRT